MSFHPTKMLHWGKSRPVIRLCIPTIWSICVITWIQIEGEIFHSINVARCTIKTKCPVQHDIIKCENFPLYHGENQNILTLEVSLKYICHRNEISLTQRRSDILSCGLPSNMQCIPAQLIRHYFHFIKFLNI